MPKHHRGHGEGSIYCRKDGLWAGAFTTEGKRRKTVYGKTRREVQLKLAEAMRQHAAGTSLDTERMTMAQFLARWHESTKPSLRAATAVRHDICIRLHLVPHLGHVPVSKLTPLHIQSLYAKLLKAGMAPGSVRSVHATLHVALEKAVKWNYALRNVADLVDQPRLPRHEMTTLSPEQARHLLDTAHGDRLEALYVLALSTGMRRGELLGLRWSDVDLDGRRVHVRMTLDEHTGVALLGEAKSASARRRITLSRGAAEALRLHRVRQLEERLEIGQGWPELDAVFLNWAGGWLRGSVVTGRFNALLERAGLPHMRFHDLRHTAATLQLGEGVHPKIVSEMLGHSNISMTLNLYSHCTPTMQQLAADVMDKVLFSEPRSSGAQNNAV